MTLKSHSGCVNAMAWAPHAATYMATAGDDGQTFIWDINTGGSVKLPVHASKAEDAINQLQWSNIHPEWLSICYNTCLEILRL